MAYEVETIGGLGDVAVAPASLIEPSSAHVDVPPMLLAVLGGACLGALALWLYQRG